MTNYVFFVIFLKEHSEVKQKKMARGLKFCWEKQTEIGKRFVGKWRLMLSLGAAELHQNK